MPKFLLSAQILDITYHTLTCMNQTTSSIQVFIVISSLFPTVNIKLTILIDPQSKILGLCLERKWTFPMSFEKCSIVTLQQMMTPSPLSTLLWSTLLLDAFKTMLTWANPWKLIKPCNPTWMPSCMNSNQLSTKWTTAMHIYHQCQIDMSPLLLLCGV